MKRVAIANPKQVKIIAHAKIKTDTIDAGVLAQLYASGFLPELWVPDEATQALRRQVSRRQQIVKQRSRLNINAAYSSQLAVFPGHGFRKDAVNIKSNDAHASPS